jgi:hypothetical protein
MRMTLSILSWNEHVDRPFTSRTHHQQAHHNKRNLGRKAYKKKTYSFVTEIWNLLISVLEDRELLPGLDPGANYDHIDNCDEQSDDE